MVLFTLLNLVLASESGDLSGNHFTIRFVVVGEKYYFCFAKKLSSMKLLAKSLIISATAVLSLEASASQEHKLWYDKPAQVWTEALPLGNGRLGAMVYGNPGAEQIQLNEETIWAGQPN